MKVLLSCNMSVTNKNNLHGKHGRVNFLFVIRCCSLLFVVSQGLTKVSGSICKKEKRNERRTSSIKLIIEFKKDNGMEDASVSTD